MAGEELKRTVPQADLDAELLEYIKGVRLRKQILGIREEQLWDMALRIQKYYEQSIHNLELGYEARLDLLRSERGELIQENNELRQKLLWLIDRIRNAEAVVNEN